MRLLGYQVDRESFRPGETVTLTLAWQTVRPASSNYAIFIHLLDEAGLPVAQRDTFHGLGNYPSSFWQPDHSFLESYQIPVPETAYAPAELTLQVGLYSLDQDYRLETTPETADRALVLQPVELLSLPGDLPNPQAVNFDNQIYLRGYAIEPRVVQPGEGVLFQFYWELPQAPAAKYSVLLHVIDDDERIWASYDGHPHYPMDEWPLNEPAEDLRYLVFPEEMPAGMYRVELGIYPIGEPNKRLPMVAEDGHWLGDRLFLNPIRVLPTR